MMCLAERRCTGSSLWILEAVYGSQMMLAYSKMGRTSVVYAVFGFALACANVSVEEG